MFGCHLGLLISAPKDIIKEFKMFLPLPPGILSQGTMLASGQALDKPLPFPSLWSVALFTPESIQIAAPMPTPTEVGRDWAATSGIITYRE